MIKVLVNRFNVHSPIFILSEKDLKKLISNQPSDTTDIKTLHVTINETLINPKIEFIQTNDKYYLFENIIYLNCMNSYGKTKLTNNYFEKRLNSNYTTRNWKTILKLNQLLEIINS